MSDSWFVDKVEGLGPGQVLEELLGERDHHCLIILEKLDIDVHLRIILSIIFLIVKWLHLRAISLQYAPMRVRRPWPILHLVHRLMAVVSVSEVLRLTALVIIIGSLTLIGLLLGAVL